MISLAALREHLARPKNGGESRMATGPQLEAYFAFFDAMPVLLEIASAAKAYQDSARPSLHRHYFGTALDAALAKIDFGGETLAVLTTDAREFWSQDSDGRDILISRTYTAEAAQEAWDAARRVRSLVIEREYHEDRYKGRFVRGWSEDDGFFYAESPDEDPGSKHRES